MHLTTLLSMAVDGFGDRVVIGSRTDGLTPRQLERLARGGATLAADADAIVFLAVNGPAFPVALFAAAYAGVPLVPLNYRLGAEQLDDLMARHPSARVVSDESFLAAAAGADPVEAAADSDSPAVIIYTSGTTSAPKGVLLRHANLVSYVFGTVEFAGAGADEAALVSVPPYHIAGISNVLSNLFAGRRVVSLPAFDPAEWLATVRAEDITNAMVVPTMLARIMTAEGDRSAPSLRALAYGGAAMPPRVIETALREWPRVGFVNAYGLTETSSTVSVLSPADHRAALASGDPEVRARLHSAGRAVPGVEVEVRDGRIWIRGEQVSGEYAGTGPAVDARGFFDTRDSGRLDADGYLFVTGRVDDTIIRGGENIAPAEIEDVLLRHPAVADAAVVGVPDEEWGQRLEAVVVPAPGVAPDAEVLRGHVRSALRGSKTPERIVFHDELPRTPTGKLLRREVLILLASAVAGEQ
ncbi:MAG TPA: AMP-binding protein [Sporichthyaceae bacterium]|nr:AMP-binding protein [Sporichthyaceae bacterium]